MLSLAPSNAALVRQVLRGRRERFNVLVRRHLNAVYAVAYSFTTNHADAEDVAQDAFLKAYTSLDTLREPAKFEGWVMTIARNSALRAIKKRHRDKEREKEASIPAKESSPNPAREELFSLLGEQMQALDEPHREVLMLHYFAGKRTREIAGLLDLSQAAVLKRLQRAREALGGKMVQELAGSRGETAWVNARSKEIGKLVLAASAGWTATQSGGGLAIGATLLSGRALALGAVGVSSIAAVIAVGMLKDPDPPLEPVETIVVATETSEADPQDVQEPAETLPEQEPEPESAPSESEAEIVEEEPALSAITEPSETVEAPKIDFDKILQSRVGIVFQDVYLMEIVEFVSEAHKLPILIDAGAVYIPDAAQAAESDNKGEREYYTDGLFESIDMQDVTLIEILDEVTSAFGLSYISEPGFIWISTPALIAAEVKREPDSRFDTYENEEHAFKTIGLVPNDMHLMELMGLLRGAYELNLVLDYRVVQPHPNIRPSFPPPNSIPEGYASDGWIPYMHLQNIELRDVFKVLLRPLNLTYEVRDNVIVISSTERLALSNLPDESLMTPDAMGEKMKVYRTKIASENSGRSGMPSKVDAKLETLTLISLQETDSGDVRAEIRLPRIGTWYAINGEAFAQFVLVQVNLNSGCCIVVDRELGQQIGLCLPLDE